MITGKKRINRHWFAGIFITLLLISSLFSISCAQKPELRILVVHSYHESWGWNQDIQKGIIEGKIPFIAGPRNDSGRASGLLASNDVIDAYNTWGWEEDALKDGLTPGSL